MEGQYVNHLQFDFPLKALLAVLSKYSVFKYPESLADQWQTGMCSGLKN